MELINCKDFKVPESFESLSDLDKHMFIYEIGATLPPLASMGYKMCNKCGKIKKLDEFHKSTGKIDGRMSRCKECSKEYEKKRKIISWEEIRKREKGAGFSGYVPRWNNRD